MMLDFGYFLKDIFQFELKKTVPKKLKIVQYLLLLHPSLLKMANPFLLLLKKKKNLFLLEEVNSFWLIILLKKKKKVMRKDLFFLLLLRLWEVVNSFLLEVVNSFSLLEVVNSFLLLEVVNSFLLEVVNPFFFSTNGPKRKGKEKQKKIHNFSFSKQKNR